MTSESADEEKDQAIWIREHWRDARHSANEGFGLTCYGREGHDHLFALWRDEGDQQLLEWQDLGPHGMVWALWVNEKDPNDMVIALERRDDDAQPPIAEVRLMRLPAGKQCPQLLSADYGLEVECVYFPDNAVMLRWFPHESDAIPNAGFGLMDLNFAEKLPPVALRTPSPVWDRPHLVEYQLPTGEGRSAWAVSDIAAARQVIPPIYEELTHEGEHWIANHPDEGCDFLSMDGTLLVHHEHRLHRGMTGGQWYAEKNGKWGFASSDGTVKGGFTHDSLEALQDEPILLGDLQLPEPAVRCAVLPSRMVKSLRISMRGSGCCFKYEGLQEVSPHEGGDGYADLQYAVLPDGQKCILLSLRYESERWLVLERKWHHLDAGSLLLIRPSKVLTPVRAEPVEALRQAQGERFPLHRAGSIRLEQTSVDGHTPLLPCEPDGTDEAFVLGIVEDPMW